MTKQATISDKDDEIEFETLDQGFAAYLATKFMFMGTIDTGIPMNRQTKNTKKKFTFLVPKTEDMNKHQFDYDMGAAETSVPFVVAFNKLRLMRQACRQPYNSVKG